MSQSIQSSALSRVPGIAHGFGTRAEPIPAAFERYWDQHPTKTQVHGIALAEVTASAQECGQVDSLFTRGPGLMVTIMTADCVPILLARRDGGMVAGTHAGWRGTRAGALRALWERLRSEGENPRGWVAAIGPSIGPCCYETSEEIAADFAKEFGRFGSGLAVPAHRRLDLPAINQACLQELGLGEVELIRACTMCSKSADGFAFNSYRREGSGTRQWSVIGIGSPFQGVPAGR